MDPPSDSEHVELQVADANGIEAIVLGFRMDGTFHELAAVSPPARGFIATPPDDALEDTRSDSDNIARPSP